MLWDMDGTLVDSEKVWDVSLAALYEKLGGVLTPAVRASMVGSVAENTMRIVYTDLGLDLDPDGDGRVQPLAATTTPPSCSMAVCRGATGRTSCWKSLPPNGTPMALVTNTQRALTERALNGIGRHYFSATVCGDEVANGKPAPDPYLRAAELLGLAPRQCLAVEDSVTGTAAAEARRMPGPGGAQRRRRARRRAGEAISSSLAGVDAAQLRRIHADLDRGRRRTLGLSSPRSALASGKTGVFT